MVMVIETCANCENRLTADERLNRFQTAGGLLCQVCEQALFYADCSICGMSNPKDQYGDVVAVFSVADALPETPDGRTGFYRIIRKPFFTNNYFDMWTVDNVLSYIRSLPDGIDRVTGSGDVCADCIERNQL